MVADADDEGFDEEAVGVVVLVLSSVLAALAFPGFPIYLEKQTGLLWPVLPQ